MEDCVIERRPINGLKLSELMERLGCKILSLSVEMTGIENVREEPLFPLKMTYIGVPGSGLEECEESVEIMPYRMYSDLSLLPVGAATIELSDATVSVVFVYGEIPKIRWESAVGSGIKIHSIGKETPRGNYLVSLPNYTCNLVKVFYFQ